jgi:hypothetical protein
MKANSKIPRMATIKKTALSRKDRKFRATVKKAAITCGFFIYTY